MSEMTKIAETPQLGMGPNQHPGIAARFSILLEMFIREQRAIGGNPTKEAFSKAIGARGNNIHNWMNGHRPGINSGIQICRALKITLDYLYAGELDGVVTHLSHDIEKITAEMGLEDVSKLP
jgi:hypothetical protein